MPKNQEAVYIGIDGGASKTEGVTGTATGRIVRRVLFDPSNPMSVGEEKALHILAKAVRVLKGRAPLARLVVGLAGVETPTQGRQLAKKLAHMLRVSPLRVDVVNDVHIAFSPDAPRQRSVAVIAGTGSHVLARGPKGLAEASALGPVLGDDGSGYALGRLALRAVVGATRQQGPPTKLVAMVHRHFATRTLAGLANKATSANKKEIAAVAILVIRTATSGDRVATSILKSGAQDLALSTRAAIRRAGLRGTFPLYVTGGIFRSAQYYRAYRAIVQKQYPGVDIRFVVQPARNALVLAHSHAS